MEEALNNFTILLEVCQQSVEATLAHVEETASQVDSLCEDIEVCFTATNTDMIATIQMLQLFGHIKRKSISSSEMSTHL